MGLWEETEPRDTTPKIMCEKCGLEIPEYEAIHLFDGVYGYNYLCEGCLAEYAGELSHEYYDEFIDEKEEKHFYLEWWFNSLGDGKKLEIVREAFEKPMYWDEIDDAEADKRKEEYKKGFCENQNDFLAYVIERVKQ